MTESTVHSAISEIYAIFGKNAPSRSSTVVEVIARRVEDIPDRVRDYIVDRVAQNKALPANLSQAFRDAWDSYCQAHPTAAGRGNKCQYCYGNGGWNYFKAFGEAWHPFPFWSFCPHCTPMNEATRKTPRQLQDEGAKVVPSNYPGGVERFRQVEILGWVPAEAASVPPVPKRIQPGYAEG